MKHDHVITLSAGKRGWPSCSFEIDWLTRMGGRFFLSQPQRELKQNQRKQFPIFLKFLKLNPFTHLIEYTKTPNTKMSHKPFFFLLAD